MSYPPPPGLQHSAAKPSSSTSLPHPSLPARPPPSAGPTPLYKQAAPTHPSPSSSAPGTTGYGEAKGYGGSGAGGVSNGSFNAFTGFRPRSLGAPMAGRWNATTPSSSATNPSMNYATAQPNYNSYTQGAHAQSYTSSTNDPRYFQAQPPQIHNPFPLPGQDQLNAGRGRGDTYDPESEAQIAQWQSAYAGKEDWSTSKGSGRGRQDGLATAGGANALPLGNRAALGTGESVGADKGVAAVGSSADGKQKTVIRSGGGQQWQDPTLLEWDPAHFRLFIGNLAGEVTDDSLLKAFSRYGSLQKARVVREKRTNKSKGYGFVSFSDGDEYFLAAKEMQGKYIGNHPIQIKRSTTEIKPTVPVDKRKHGKGGKSSGKPSGGGGANTGAGVHKKQTKTKGGLRILG